ncbi:CocE/NonD family hydrolase [Mesorhizobium sp. M0296]|uniref:CocE/NonD family hydrolase n=1 Tax=Mesorhizobium sp. M0296 TaxID=2956931 RepID=UPI00333AFE34
MPALPQAGRDVGRRRAPPSLHYFAGHGYVGVRVDMRGTGDSDGAAKANSLCRSRTTG